MGYRSLKIKYRSWEKIGSDSDMVDNIADKIDTIMGEVCLASQHVDNADTAPIGYGQELRLGLNHHHGKGIKINNIYLGSTPGPVRKGHIMSIIIKKTETGYELHDGETITRNLKVVFDPRKGCGDIKLPENSLGKKWLSESRFTDGITEIDLNNMPTRSQSGTPTTLKSPTLKWEDFVSEEDQKVLAEIKARAERAMAKKKAENDLEKAMAEVARLQALLMGETEEAEG